MNGDALEAGRGLGTGRQDLIPRAAPDNGGTATSVLGGTVERHPFETQRARRILDGAVERGRQEFERQALGIAFQHRTGDALALGQRDGEGAQAGLVVLGVAPQHGGRREDHRRGPGILLSRMGGAQPGGGAPRAVAHGVNAAGGGRHRTRSVQFDTECARQQSVARRHQRIDPGGQTRHALAEGDLPPDGGIAGALLCGNRRIRRLHTGHDGVDRVAGQARQREAALGMGLHQGIEPCVGGSAAARQETRTEQLAAAAQVQQCIGLHIHGMAAEGHLGFEADAIEHDIDAVVGVGQAVDGTAVGQHQPECTHRGHAAGQQRDLTGVAGCSLAQVDGAQRGTQHAALLDGARGQGQRAEYRVRNLRRRIAVTLDADAACGVDDGFHRAPLVGTARLAGHDDTRVAGGRIDLRGSQQQVAGRLQTGRTAQAQVAAAAQRQLVETQAFDGQGRIGVQQDVAAHTEVVLSLIHI